MHAGKESLMNEHLLKLYIMAQRLREEHGQDLIEYALTAALIALGATAAMTGVANNISTALASVGTKLTSTLS
jgi:Flp pilus assembly pilin Flp